MATRFITATSLFDGHDAAIQIMRRIMQSQGAHVIHLGHHCSVEAVLKAALDEDAHAVAISSYQGGHVEYFTYLRECLDQSGAEHVHIFGGGGGVIIPEEIDLLHERGITRIYSPHDGQTMGLNGMIADMLFKAQTPRVHHHPTYWGRALSQQLVEPLKPLDMTAIPIVGITGTGGAGKSSLSDELLLRIVQHHPQCRIAVLAFDPIRQKTGGALLGDRIRMNALEYGNIHFRSIATKDLLKDIEKHATHWIPWLIKEGFDLIVLETPGIGQGDSPLSAFVNTSIYVMTPEFGAQSQLEKIGMLDVADFIAINKFDRFGAEDALRDVRKQVLRNRQAFGQSPEEMPVYPTIAAHFQDAGVNALYAALLSRFNAQGLGTWKMQEIPQAPRHDAFIPVTRRHYLAQISATIREYHEQARAQAALVKERAHLETALAYEPTSKALLARIAELSAAILPAHQALLEQWPESVAQYEAQTLEYTVRGQPHQMPLQTLTLSDLPIPKVALPHYECPGQLLHWQLTENLPGAFPYTAGVFAFKRTDESPSRLFAGEGGPARTNKRFHLLSEGMPATRLSTAFDSVTLYGFDPNQRPDIYGKIGNAGVSIATLEDMKRLFEGFDLCAPNTSVSMTINGPSPTILAFFFNAAIDQQIEKFQQKEGRAPNKKEYEVIKRETLKQVRGTVQADILKEDQAQNTCIFSKEFSLRMMVDMQAYFIEQEIKNFYSVSISGYHIAEAGANPITQLAFTLANGFTYVEAYLAHGLAIDDFAPNLSFFFSNGMDAEYTVMGRVARRIWAIAMDKLYGGNTRSQKLKYHIQTSGRSLHAQEMTFNDIRTTLEALCAYYDHCNSLHTNAFDEAITTPTEASVRQALAIQLIIQKEWGLSSNENPLQGSFIIEQLTDLVEEAVLCEFENLSRRGGVLGAMETGYQRGKIQDESMRYEHRKHEGSLPIIGVNTFLAPKREEEPVPLSRSSEAEKNEQIQHLEEFHAQHADKAPAALEALSKTIAEGGNAFATLMDSVRHCSLGQISEHFYRLGGKYRRGM